VLHSCGRRRAAVDPPIFTVQRHACKSTLPERAPAILSLIGNTPLIEITRMDTAHASFS
jgi:hypothetical protein